MTCTSTYWSGSKPLRLLKQVDFWSVFERIVRTNVLVLAFLMDWIQLKS